MVIASFCRALLSTHRIDEALRHRILTLLRENYVDFGSTLPAEKLQERHGITISVEALRCWMTADGLWIPHACRQTRIYQPRLRRDCLGELIQIDGSHHDWFEGRFNRPAKYPKNLHRTVSESSPDLDDIFACQTLRTL